MHAPVPRLAPAARRAEAAWLVFLLALCAVVLAWRWVGFQGHDDAYYAAAALDWRRLGTDHWALRYPLVLPMAAALAVIGPHLVALALPTLIAYLAWLLSTYLGLRTRFGWQTAALAALAGILVPEFPVQATYANPDLLELAFVLAAFWCHQAALRTPDRMLPLLHCGVLAGLAFLTRETSAALVLYFGALCAVRPGMPRRLYAPVALSFAAVVGCECAYFAVRAGDYLYRAHLSAAHDMVDRAAQATRAAAAGHALDSEGVLAGGPVWQVFAALCVSQKYGLLFVLAAPATWYALRGERLSPAERRVVTDAALLAGSFILFVALAASKLYIVPRYFTAAAGAAVIPLAAAGGCLWRARPRLAAAAIVLCAATCVPLLAVENTDPLFAVRRLLALAADPRALIHTDPYTAAQAAIPLRLAGLTNRVSTDPPAPGDLVAIPDGVALACLASRTCGFKARMAPFTPTPGWVRLRCEAAPTPLPGRLVQAIGLARFTPPDILRKLASPNPALCIYRVAAAGAPADPR
jgi:4-amino-4-deoxy-L-arabinose transferase-like glycosyltransferase